MNLIVLACAVSILPATAAHFESPNFAARHSHPGASGFQAFVGDFNGDSVPDVVVQQDYQVVTYVGKKDGTFSTGPSSPLPEGDEIQFTATADFNNDGNLDLIYMPENARTILTLLGRGDGTFASAVAVPEVTDADMFTVGDFNGDGVPDVAIITYDNFLKVALGNGDGTFAAPIVTQLASPIGIGAVYLNRDRYEDLVITTSTATSLLLGRGDGTFSQGQSFPIGCYNFATTRSGDLNGDGLPDVVVGCYGSANQQVPYVATFLSRGDGTVHGGSLISLTGVVQDIELGDVNGDGNTDVLAAGGLGDVYVLLGTGKGTLLEPYGYESDAGTTWAGLADLKGSGQLDAVLLNSSAYTWSVMLNNGKGKFTDGVPISPAINAMWAVEADVNKDGLPDLVLAGYGQIQVLYGTGKAKAPFSAGPALSAPDSDFVYVVCGDLNGDGADDLVYLYQDQQQNFSWFAAVYLGSAAGSFQYLSTFPAGSPNRSTGPGVIVDLNHDGKPDLVTTSGVMLGNGDGTFGAFTAFPTTIPFNIGGGYNFPPAVGDFNDDGNLDVATFQNEQSNFDSYIAILLGNGDGTFQAPAVTQYLGNSLSTGDFNHDGNLDLVIGQTAAGFQLLLGNGKGGFRQSTDVDLAVAADFITSTIGDFNGDGNLDVAVVDKDGFTVYVVLGDGKGNFYNAANPIVLGTGPYPLEILTGQFHTGGSPGTEDLLTVNGTLTLLPNITPH